MVQSKNKNLIFKIVKITLKCPYKIKFQNGCNNI